jgi:type IV pilus assembly protein PilW
MSEMPMPAAKSERLMPAALPKRPVTQPRPMARRMRGMSLIEILVAAAIGLIGIVVISEVYLVSERMKRSTSGGSDANVTGNLALYTIERELRMAGFGMVTNTTNMLGCTTLGYDNTMLGSNTYSFTMAPVVITQGTSGAPDTLAVAYGNSATMMDGVGLTGSAASGADLPLKNAAGFMVNNFAVVYELGKSCSLIQTTGFQPAALNTLIHAVGRYNPSGGPGVAYTSNAMLFDWGPTPVVKTFAILNTSATKTRLLTQSRLPYTASLDTGSTGTVVQELGEEVVNMKALYGKDTDGDRVVDTWDATTPTTNAGWLQVRAVRVALLVRSAQYESAAVTTTAPVWTRDATDTATPVAISFTMSNAADGTNWQNYHYNVYQTTVALRNMIWSNDP